MSDLSALVDATGSLAALRNFMAGGDLRRTLNIVGDVHFIAAEEALSGAGTREIRADIREARAHLRAAHVAYRQIYDFRFRPIFYLATLGIREVPMLIAGLKDHIACSLIAATYSYFGDTQNTEIYLSHAERARKLISHHTLYPFINRWQLSLGTPFGIPKLSAYTHPRSLTEVESLINTVGQFDFEKFSAGLKHLGQS
ncbi:hypothetical protein M1L60_43530 [Actinoplanes sp. TRM 88003]|uniref:Uncharacterized protein n=1 Tax=Paractinoplanes aksuensis TaxID=2939490 RepID=A0ABT1E2W1_9ACTN|nr:hypothetical protein [Actinoplanes aksuensis]MCO8277473.1 hypothetical protein [Actinoplanes aksuensis]